MSLVDDQGNNLVNPADSNNNAIRWARYNGHINVVKYLKSLPSVYGIEQ